MSFYYFIFSILIVRFFLVFDFIYTKCNLNDNRSISIVINNNNSNMNNKNDDKVPEKVKFNKIKESENKVNFSNFFKLTNKKIICIVLLVVIYYIKFFKISSLLSLFVFLKNKIANIFSIKSDNE